MTKKIAFIMTALAALLLLSAPAYALGRFSNGGSVAGIIFKEIAQRAIEQILKSGPIPGISSAALETLLDQAKVVVSAQPLFVTAAGVRQRSVATNDPQSKTILLDDSLFNPMPYAQQMALALHEILGLAGIEATGDYHVSEKLLDPADGPPCDMGVCAVLPVDQINEFAFEDALKLFEQNSKQPASALTGKWNQVGESRAPVLTEGTPFLAFKDVGDFFGVPALQGGYLVARLQLEFASARNGLEVSATETSPGAQSSTGSLAGVSVLAGTGVEAFTFLTQTPYGIPARTAVNLSQLDFYQTCRLVYDEAHLLCLVSILGSVQYEGQSEVFRPNFPVSFELFQKSP